MDKLEETELKTKKSGFQPHELYNAIEHNLVECYDIVGDVV